MLPWRTGMALWVPVLLAWACDQDPGAAASHEENVDEAAPERGAAVDTQGEAVDPPFEVAGECDGLLLAWFDGEGVHSASKRSEIPEEHRARVRVDSLRLPPEQRLDPRWVYVADLREPGPDGGYRVRKMRRAAFDAVVDAAASAGRASDSAGARARPGAGTDADVVVYGASWCKACDEAARFLEERGVPFAEHDIERDPEALAEMQRKAREAGVQPSGIPVIDFKGHLVQGFDRTALERLIAQAGTAI